MKHNVRGFFSCKSRQITAVLTGTEQESKTVRRGNSLIGWRFQLIGKVVALSSDTDTLIGTDQPVIALCKKSKKHFTPKKNQHKKTTTSHARGSDGV